MELRPHEYHTKLCLRMYLLHSRSVVDFTEADVLHEPSLTDHMVYSVLWLYSIQHHNMLVCV